MSVCLGRLSGAEGEEAHGPTRARAPLKGPPNNGLKQLTKSGQISRIEGAGREVLASELHITCAFLPPSFMALLSMAEPETLGKLFVEELRRHQEEQRKKSDWDIDME